jgi:CheY-like chemotaxis protein
VERKTQSQHFNDPPDIKREGTKSPPRPAREPAERRRAEPCEPAAILVVEDEELVRRFLVARLEELGRHLVAAEDAERAIELAAAQRSVSLFVLDCTLPGLGGRELAQRLRALHPQAAVLFVSGYGARELSLEPGGLPERCAFLAKPFGGNDLLARARELLALDG